MSASARLILDDPRDAASNMAVDEALLEAGGAGLVIRRTAWCAPALTIGRFQPYPEREPPGSDPVHQDVQQVVRRITGGGAIRHGADLTLAILFDDALAAAPNPAGACARELRGSAAAACRISSAIATALRPPSGEVMSRGGASFERAQSAIADCFDRRAPSDIVLRSGGDGAGAADGSKVAGIALHRRTTRWGDARWLVQGSIARAPLDLAPERDSEFLARLASALGAPAAHFAPLAAPELERAARLARVRYALDSWNRRVPPTSVHPARR